jgi:nitrate/nitrite transporter NarK
MPTKLFRATNIVLGLLCLMYFLTYLDRVNITTAMASNEFLREIPLTKTQAGFVFSAFAYPYLIFQIIGGWVADKFGPRLALTVCGVIWAAATIMTGLVHGLTMLVVARLILGFGEGATFPTATRAMSNWMPKEKRGYAQGITHAFSRLGNSITPWLVVSLIAAISWRGSFVVVGGVSLVWALIWGLYYRNDPQKHGSITREEMAELPAYGASRTHVLVPWTRLGLRMFPVILVYFCYGWTLWLFLSWIPHHRRSGERQTFRANQRRQYCPAKRRRDHDGALLRLTCADPVHTRHQDCRDRLERRFLLRGVHGRPDVGDPDGYRSEILRHRERHDEHRVGTSCDRLARRFRLHRRQDRTLDLAVRRLDGAHALWRCSDVRDAAGPAAG